jgi:hypothetical protein
MEEESTESPLDNKDKRRQPVALAVKCQSCIFFKDRAYKTFKKPCSELGVKQYSRPCQHFFANPFIFLKDDPEFKLAKRLFVKYSKSLPSLVSWLNQELATRKKGFAFGQIVYVHMIGGDYLQNYAKVTVVSANKEYVYIQGKTFRGQYLHSSIYDEAAWKKKKRSLERKNLIRDPKHKEYYTHTVPKVKNYEVPTLDDFVNLVKKTKKVKKVISLVSRGGQS